MCHDTWTKGNAEMRGRALVILLLALSPRIALAERGPAKGTISLCGLDVALNATKLELRNRECESSDFRLLARLKHLEHLVLDWCGVTDSDLAVLTSLPRLEKLALGDRDITNVALRHVAKLDRLRELDLGGFEKLTSSGLGRLVDMPRLESIRLDEKQITDIALVHISKMKHLRTVDSRLYAGCEHKSGCFDFRGGSISVRGIAALKTLSVQHLQVSPGVLDDRVLLVISRIPSLKSLNCANVVIGKQKNVAGCFDVANAEKVTSTGLRHLKSKSVHLFTPGGEKGAAELRVVSTFPRLRTLNCRTCTRDLYGGGCAEEGSSCEEWEATEGCVDLSESDLTYGDLLPLRKMSIAHLLVASNSIDSKVFKLLVSLPRLRILNCPPGEGGCVNLEGTKIVGADLPLLSGVSDLRELRLPEKIEIVPPAARFMANRKSLGRVSTGRSLASIYYRSAVAFCDGALTYDLRGAKVENRALELLSKSKNVEQLCIAGKSITDVSVPHLVSFGNLLQLDVRETAITAKGIRGLLAMDDLETLHAPKSAVIDSVIPHVAKHATLRRLNAGRENCGSSCDAVIHDTCRYGGCGPWQFDEDCVQKGKAFCSQGCAEEEDVLWIGLEDTSLTATGLRRLASIPKRLRLEHAHPDDGTIEPLATLKNLVSLNCFARNCVDLRRSGNTENLKNGKLSLAAVRHLSKVKHLRVIRLPNQLIGDEALEALVTMPNLRSLNRRQDFERTEGFDLSNVNVRSGRLSPRGVALLDRANRLRRLLLPVRLIDDEVLAILSNIPHLRSVNCGLHEFPRPLSQGCVNLEATKVTAKGLASLKGFERRLHAVHLEKSLVTDDVLALLSKLPALGSLNCEAQVPESRPPVPDTCVNLNGTKVTEEGLDALVGFEGNSQLQLPSGLITDQTLARLISRMKVSSLNCESLGRPHRSVYYNTSWLVPSCFDLYETSVTYTGLKRLGRLSPQIVVLPEGLSQAKAEKLLPRTDTYTEPPGINYHDY